VAVRAGRQTPRLEHVDVVFEARRDPVAGVVGAPRARRRALDRVALLREQITEVVARHAPHADTLARRAVAALAVVEQHLVDERALGVDVVVVVRDYGEAVAEDAAVEQCLARQIVEVGFAHAADDEASVLLRLALQIPVGVVDVERRHRSVLG
jgi:hypothetical protein